MKYPNQDERIALEILEGKRKGPNDGARTVLKIEAGRRALDAQRKQRIADGKPRPEDLDPFVGLT